MNPTFSQRGPNSVPKDGFWGENAKSGDPVGPLRICPKISGDPKWGQLRTVLFQMPFRGPCPEGFSGGFQLKSHKTCVRTPRVGILSMGQLTHARGFPPIENSWNMFTNQGTRLETQTQ